MEIQQHELFDFISYNKSLRRKIYNKFNGDCQLCHKHLVFKKSLIVWLVEFMVNRQKAKDLRNLHLMWVTECHIHHLIPKYKGGTNNPKNLILLCPKCHRYIQAWMYFWDALD